MKAIEGIPFQLAALRKSLLKAAPHLCVQAVDGGLVIRPSGPLTIAVIHDSGYFSMVFNEVPLDSHCEEEAYRLIMYGIEGRLRIVTERVRGELVAARLELRGESGEWEELAGYGRRSLFRWGGLERKIACNAPEMPVLA